MQKILSRLSTRSMVLIGMVGVFAAAAQYLSAASHSYTGNSTGASLALNDAPMCSATDSKKGSVLFIGCGGFF